ncbi:MAG: hypothetical protein FJX77_03730 [Armatimonadetes bacterium]|nr:hypothetical protein [Armatimonadota bacterium]
MVRFSLQTRPRETNNGSNRPAPRGAAPRARRRLKLRSRLARVAHFRTGAGPMGGDRRQQARRRRREDRLEEQQTVRKIEEGS